MDKVAMGRKIRLLRRGLGLSQADMEKKSGVSNRSIQQIESGAANPGVDTLESIAGVLGVSIVELVKPTPVPVPKNTKARAVAAAANPQEMVAGLEFLTAFVRQEKDIQLVAMALVFEDLSYLKQVSPEYREQLSRLSQQLLKALG